MAEERVYTQTWNQELSRWAPGSLSLEKSWSPDFRRGSKDESKTGRCQFPVVWGEVAGVMPTGSPLSPAWLQWEGHCGRAGSELQGNDMPQRPKFLVMISPSTGRLCRS